ncbi:hypothetical protein I6F26_10255 [Ensifer sp. IC3342]|nr:hypothetical protein [Ensifer sp. BRP08]MCA1446961.1 hypothetical protein [Ensifer sp. IC3342]
MKKLVVAALAAAAFASAAQAQDVKAMTFEDFIVDAPDLVGQVVSVPCTLGFPDSQAIHCGGNGGSLIIRVATMKNREDLRRALKECEGPSAFTDCKVIVTGTYDDDYGLFYLDNASIKWRRDEPSSFNADDIADELNGNTK